TSAHPDLHSFPTRRSSDLQACPTECCMPHQRKGGNMSRDRKRAMGPMPWRCLFVLVLGCALSPAFAQVLPAPSDRLCTAGFNPRSEEHTSELQSRENLVCR